MLYPDFASTITGVLNQPLFPSGPVTVSPFCVFKVYGFAGTAAYVRFTLYPASPAA